MGIWEFIYSTTDTVKTNAPDLSDPLTNAYRTSYDYGSAAVSKIDEVVKGHMPDEKGREQITNFAVKFGKNVADYAVKEGYQVLPGGKQMGKIVSKTIEDMKSENQKMVMEAAKEEASNVESGKSPSRNIDDVLVLEAVGTKIKAVDYLDHQKGISTANQTPEDVLRIFMMKEFIGTRFLDDLIIPQKRNASRIPPK